jgi:hypothetical protein
MDKFRVQKSETGWEIMSQSGHVLNVLPEVCIMADVKHGLALFPGSRSWVEDRISGVKRRCVKMGAPDDVEKMMMVLTLPGDVSEEEMSYMLNTLKMPRRVKIRAEKMLREKV